MNRERLLDLADMIENDRLEGVVFDMSVSIILHEGHIHACIAGCTVIAAYGVARARDVWLVSERAKCILGLSGPEALRLFSPPGYDIAGTTLYSKERAVRVLRHAAATGQIEWGI